MPESQATRDHETIRQWAEARGGHPSSVTETAEKDDPGILRLDFDPRDSGLTRISWDEFFRKFDEADLSFLYEDKQNSRFHKFVRN